MHYHLAAEKDIKKVQDYILLFTRQEYISVMFVETHRSKA